MADSISVTGLLPFIAAFFAFALIHSIMAADWFKKRCFSLLPALRFYYRAAYNLISLLFIAWIWFLVPIENALIYRIESPFHYLFFAVQILALGGLFHTVSLFGGSTFTGLRQIRDHFSGNKPEYKLDEPRQDSFIVSGPYRYVRHPLYSFSILFLIAAPVMTVKWAVFALCSILYFLLGSKPEEQKLEARFGQSYKNYKESVPGIIPLPGKKFNS